METETDEAVALFFGVASTWTQPEGWNIKVLSRASSSSHQIFKFGWFFVKKNNVFVLLLLFQITPLVVTYI